jgi:Ran GTPase-activating protein (RanGAP) involved in mRNA processing and transport
MGDLSAHSLLTPRLLTHLCRFRQLNLSNNRLCGVWDEFNEYLYEYEQKGNYNAEGINAIADALRVNGGLTVIDLLYNKLDAEAAKMLAEVTKKKGISLCGIQRDQTTADFSHKGFEPHKRIEPPDAILLASDLSQAVVTGALTSVKLRGNKLGDKGWGAIFAAICGNKDSKIMCLDASSENISPAGVKLIAEVLRTSVTGGLTALNLSYNRLQDEGVSAVCEAIQSNKETKLASLNFGDNGIGPVGANAVAAMVAVTGGLTALDLSSNRLQDEGVSAVCEAIKSNKETKLASLNFERNRIGPVGANTVAAMVAVTGGLTSIDVRQNNIAGDGAVQLAAAVLGNFNIEIFNAIPIKEMRANSLTELDLNGKYVGVEGGMVVAGLIPVMGGLTSIDLSGSKLCGIWTDRDGYQYGTYTAEGITAIADALRVNGALTKIE